MKPPCNKNCNLFEPWYVLSLQSARTTASCLHDRRFGIPRKEPASELRLIGSQAELFAFSLPDTAYTTSGCNGKEEAEEEEELRASINPMAKYVWERKGNVGESGGKRDRSSLKDSSSPFFCEFGFWESSATAYFLSRRSGLFIVREKSFFCENCS